MKGFPDLPPIWLALALTAIWLLDRFLLIFQFHFIGQAVLGWMFLGIAFGLIGWSGIWFRRKRTTIEPHHLATELLVEGPFRISRNPIYLSLVLITLGVAIGRGVLLGLPIAALLAWVIHKRFILAEEAGLVEVFGDKAHQYFAKTRRWI